jgi:hypothetical protein
LPLLETTMTGLIRTVTRWKISLKHLHILTPQKMDPLTFPAGSGYASEGTHLLNP